VNVSFACHQRCDGDYNLALKSLYSDDCY
jgi:hypothetical protein